MTYKEALNLGYIPSTKKTFMGYVSRKVNMANQEVKTAGGCRKGQLYVECPNWLSSQYSYRCYLIKAD